MTRRLLYGPGSYTYYLYLIYISAILTASTVETMLPIEEILITALKEHDYRDSKLHFSWYLKSACSCSFATLDNPVNVDEHIQRIKRQLDDPSSVCNTLFPYSIPSLIPHRSARTPTHLLLYQSYLSNVFFRIPDIPWRCTFPGMSKLQIM